MDIQWRLSVVMFEKNIDYKQLAEATGFNPVTVSRHKNMRVMPDRLERETLLKYCQALDCTPGELLKIVD
ncbi:transcriptional regulator [Nostoc sp. RF31YmG]|jgi:putative transcriptional regulator|nr:transcriptional regulator [Nostoc sp. RF31YmG]